MINLAMPSILSAGAQIVDLTGDCGSLVHYAFVIAFVGSAFLVFLYLWKKDKLDLDEDPKHKMMHEEENTVNNKEKKEP